VDWRAGQVETRARSNRTCSQGYRLYSHPLLSRSINPRSLVVVFQLRILPSATGCVTASARSAYCCHEALAPACCYPGDWRVGIPCLRPVQITGCQCRPTCSLRGTTCYRWPHRRGGVDECRASTSAGLLSDAGWAVELLDLRTISHHRIAWPRQSGAHSSWIPLDRACRLSALEEASFGTEWLVRQPARRGGRPQDNINTEDTDATKLYEHLEDSSCSSRLRDDFVPCSPPSPTTRTGFVYRL
jgi:hypothetical protein